MHIPLKFTGASIYSYEILEDVLDKTPEIDTCEPEEADSALWDLLGTGSHSEENVPDCRPQPGGGTTRLASMVLDGSTMEAICETYPDLRHEAFRALFLHSLFGQMIHANTDRGGFEHSRIMVPSWFLAKIEGKSSQWKQHNYLAHEFLEAYRQVVPCFRYTGWQKGEYTRQIEDHGVPVRLLNLIEEDLSRPLADLSEPVFALSCSPFSCTTSGRAALEVKAERDKLSGKAEERASHAKWALQRDLLTYLNTLPSNTYASLYKGNMERAISEVKLIVDRGKRLRVLMQLRLLRIQPKPYYQPSSRGRSPRVFPLNGSALTLPKDVHRALIAGCLECDLTNASLAIIAKDWGIPGLYDLLVEHGTAWPTIFEIAGFDHDDLLGSSAYDGVKSLLKKAVYAVTYGMSKQGLRWYLRNELPSGAVASFLSASLIKEILTARKERMRDIHAHWGYHDCFGQHHAVAATEREKRWKQIRSVLACLSFSRELQLLQPIIEDAIRVDGHHRPAYRLVAWQHDGFIASVSKNHESIERRFIRKVEQQAGKLDIPVQLDTEWL